MSKSKKTANSMYHYNKPFGSYMRNPWDYRATDGQEIGIEIEVEGTGLPTQAPKGWLIRPDGSLRGESAEFVFEGPATRDETLLRLDNFAKAFAGVKVNESYRTSVHVHLNAQDVRIKNIYTWIMLYTIFEDPLSYICGKDRIGNLFTLRAKDAEYYLDRLFAAVKDDYINILNDRQLRYTAVNSLALFAHGTLEFRSMRGTVDTELIQQWMNILLAIKDAAINKFENARDMVQRISSDGPDAFAELVFNKEQINLFPVGWQDQTMEGMRLIQHIAHACDWADTPPKDKKPLPRYGKYVGTANVDIDRVIGDVPRPVARNVMWTINPDGNLAPNNPEEER